IPCERDSRKIFVSPGEVAFVRADGHYTQVYTPQDRLFCAWPITEATKRLLPAGFLQTHRSYLVNPSQVSRFERSKDKGRCTFKEADLPPVPVSRSKLKDIQRTFSDTSGATGAL
ncbi:MAG: LytTR family DNA-binding domain-containing protein, partial [Pseudomonadota bacterium]